MNGAFVPLEDEQFFELVKKLRTCANYLDVNLFIGIKEVVVKKHAINVSDICDTGGNCALSHYSCICILNLIKVLVKSGSKKGPTLKN